MYDVDRFRRVFEEYGNYMRTNELSKEKIFYEYIQELISEGYIEKIRTGYYHWKEGGGGECEIEKVRYMFPDGILSMESAMYYYKYIDEIPDFWTFTFPRNSTKSRFSFNEVAIKPYFDPPEKINIGTTTIEINNVLVPISTRDRLMVDALRYRNKMERSLFSSVLKSYVEDPYKDITKMLEYAEPFRMVKIAMSLVMIWI